ncbi:MAG: methionine aminopeptidase, type I [Parcubacteria group bacterium Athens0714_12]|nr:MAG: methionine aminopeptidase, type I [Parcubacteria group bacterium Athens0714_12]
MVTIKNSEEIKIMRQGGKILALILKKVIKAAKPGVSTLELNSIAEEEIKKFKAAPAFKDYRNYPFALCASVNDEVVHSFPSAKKILKSGDIIGLDLGIKYRGYYSDMAVTVGIGKINNQAKKLIKSTKNALIKGLQQVKDGNYLGDISSAIQNYAEKNGFSVVRDLTGHGIGIKLHEDPLIPNFGAGKTGIILRQGMTFAIEPMINQGDYNIKKWLDNFYRGRKFIRPF